MKKQIFIGEYETVLDCDSGFEIPTAYLKLLRAGATTRRHAIIACLDALRVYPEQTFSEYVDELRENLRKTKSPSETDIASNQLRSLTASAHTIKWDENGRIALSEKLVMFADITPGDRIRLRGIYSYFEITAARGPCGHS